MSNNVEQFFHAMPEVAREALSTAPLNAVAVGNGVTRFEVMGHDRGVPYWFQMVEEYSPAKSEEQNREVFDVQEVCFRMIDRKNIIPMPVKGCPPEYLRFNRQGELVGGRYAEAYKRWKAGESMPGLALRKWNVLNVADVASLEADGIFTVEQLAEYPLERLTGRYPDNFIDAHKRANQWVNGKAVMEKAGEQAVQLARLEKEKSDLAERLAKLEALLEERTEPREVVNKLKGDKK